MADDSTIHFDANLSLKIFPGMLRQSKHLIEQMERGEGKQDSGAYLICAATFCALTSELLLKFKLQQEGSEIPRIHDLYSLYRRLSVETQDDIQRHFSEAVPAVQLLAGWDNVESIFQKARNAFENWRYITQTQDEPLPVIGLRPLHNAATSFCRLG